MASSSARTKTTYSALDSRASQLPTPPFSAHWVLRCSTSVQSSIVLRGKVSERLQPEKNESWALLETDCDWWTGSEGEAAVSSRQLELQWRSSALQHFLLANELVILVCKVITNYTKNNPMLILTTYVFCDTADVIFSKVLIFVITFNPKNLPSHISGGKCFSVFETRLSYRDQQAT